MRPSGNREEMEEGFTERSGIVLHSAEDFEGMRRAGRLAAEVLDYITPYVKPGIETGEIDRPV